jgi:hypothetical protein
LEKIGKNIKAELKQVGIEYKKCNKRGYYRGKLVFVGIKKRLIGQ